MSGGREKTACQTRKLDMSVRLEVWGGGIPAFRRRPVMYVRAT